MNRGLRVKTYALQRGLMLLLAVFGLAGALWAADPFIGTWKMNPAKSKTNYPLEGSFVSKVEAQDHGIRVVENLAPANGKAVQRRWAAKFDGKDYPVEGDPTIDSVSLKKAGPNGINYVLKKSGKQSASGKWIVSKDGKTSTTAGSATIANHVFTFSIFLEKQ